MKPTRRHRGMPVIVAVYLSLGASAGCLAEGSWTGNLTATSDYVLRGVSQTDEHPAIQGTLSYAAGNGWYAGAWASSLHKSDWYYPAGTAQAEIDLFAGHRFDMAEPWSADVHAVHYMYPGDGDVLDYDYTEIEASLSYRDVLRASLAWSPDTSMVSLQGLMRDSTALAYELVARSPLLPWLDIAAGVGYRDVTGLDSNGYGYWSISMTARRGALTLDLAQFGTDDDGRKLFGEHLAGGRTVVSLGWSF